MQLEDILPIVRQHAKHIALKWHDTIIDEDDLYQEGAIVVLQILENGIPDQDDAITFAYLHKRIAGRMRDALRLSQGRTVYKRSESIDAMNAYDREHILEDMVSMDDPESVCIAKEAIERIVRCLRPREIAIIEMMADGRSGAEIAAHLNVHPSRVSQIFADQIEKKLLAALS